ncbi:L7Ae/L30e/S12e/Gadd45 family ribosomal protein [Butyrivibrio sp.]|uniref:L7Ae/L30e/S12e/Gadd45 family ribosomal protein n=1 Tax=Butyrivibrio sp. TaxID=28121 RepID=UPI0025C72A91|nr:ribosomal L7Ae/L30e/S12e/Gadd45 family protein [Butyrivibrio sp.]MBE5837646.1 50S ribosomal protein L7ae [Butyrivibrio sp.]
MDSKEKLLGTLGLCQRAGKLKSGEFAVLEAIRKKTAVMVIVSNDASDNTKKEFNDKCSYYKVPIYFYGNMDELGHAIGKDVRTSLAITDAGFAKTLIKNLLSEKSTEEM